MLNNHYGKTNLEKTLKKNSHAINVAILTKSGEKKRFFFLFSLYYSKYSSRHDEISFEIFFSS